MPEVERQEATTTGYALLGLLSLRGELSGYQLKQLADRTLKFFWVSPAMSQVYSELKRMAREGLVERRRQTDGRGTWLYRVSQAGDLALKQWLQAEQVDFPGLKHGVALRLFLAHLSGPSQPVRLLDGYQDQLQARLLELREIRASLGTPPRFPYPALVAEWGIRLYTEELDSVNRVRQALSQRLTASPLTPPGGDGHPPEPWPVSPERPPTRPPRGRDAD